MKSFLDKENDELICVDRVCYSVPSSLVWKMEWQEVKTKGKTVKVDFRNKKDFGWCDHIETLCFGNEENCSSFVFRRVDFHKLI